jgi:hypothetical protein
MSRERPCPVAGLMETELHEEKTAGFDLPIG